MSRGFELTTYATPNIIGEIKRHFRDKGWAIRVPRGLQELNVRLSKLTEELTVSSSARPPSPSSPRRRVWTRKQALEAIETGHAYSTVSLSSPIGRGERRRPRPDGVDRRDRPGVRDQRGPHPRRARPQSALDERERHILHLRFYEGLTQSQIAQQVGISQMHVSRLIRRSLEKMREELVEDEENGSGSG